MWQSYTNWTCNIAARQDWMKIKQFNKKKEKSRYDWRRDKRALISLTSLSRKLTSKFVTFFPWSNQMHDDVNAVLYAFMRCRNWQLIYKMTGWISNYLTTHLFEIKAKYPLFKGGFIMKYNEYLFWSFTQFTVSAIVVREFWKDNTIIYAKMYLIPRFFFIFKNNK